MRYLRMIITGVVLILFFLHFPVTENCMEKRILSGMDNSHQVANVLTNVEKRYLSEMDVPTWSIGDWWEYNITFNNTWPDTGEFLYLNGTIRYTVTGVERFPAADGNNYLAYNASISGESRGNAHYGENDLIINGDRFSKDSLTPGDMTGYRVFRVSDLAILKERSFMEGFVHLDGVGLKFNLTESMFDLSIVDVFDLPLTPGEQFNFSTRESRSFSLYLSEAGYYLKQYSEIFPFAYEMTTSASSQVTTSAGDFDAYRFSGTSMAPDDPSTMNHSYSPVVKSYVLQDLYRITSTDDENHSLLYTTMELLDYDVQDIGNTINIENDIALNGIPVKVSGSFSGYPHEDVVITFPYTGVEVETATDAVGGYFGQIVTPLTDDNSPSDQDAGSFGVCAYLKNDMNTLVTKSIIIVESDDEFPEADAGLDRTIDEDNVLIFNGSGSSDNIGIKNYTWSFMYDGSDIVKHGELTSFNFTLPGTYSITLSIMDYGNNADMDVFQVVVRDVTPPVSVVPFDIVIDEGTRVVFNGTGSFDPESGLIEAYAWCFDYNGSTISLSGELANHTFCIPGSYVVFLNVTDIAGNYDEDFFTITVNDITPPFAEPGHNITIDQHETVYFNASASYDNVGITDFYWKFVYNGTREILYGKDANYTFDLAGTYEVILNVSDEAGNWHASGMTVTVNDITGPVAYAGPNVTVDQGNVVHMDGGASTDNVGVVNYTWEFMYDDDEMFLYGMKINFTFATTGVYEIHLTVFDAAGNSDSCMFNISVIDVTPPIVPAGLNNDREVEEGEEVELNAGAWEDSGSSTLTYIWTFTYDNEVVTLHGNNPDFDFDIPGNYTITLTVVNEEGLSSTTLFHINIIDTTPDNEIKEKEMNFDEGEKLVIRVPDDFVDMDIVEYHWSYTDSNGEEIYFKTSNPELPVRYLDKGTYEITLTVKDKEGNTAKQVFTVKVGVTKSSGEEEKVEEVGDVFYFAVGGMVLLFLPVIIFLIYTFVKRGRKPEEELKKAKVVEAEVMEVETIEYYCLKCDGEIDEGDEKCAHCGYDFSE